MRVSNLLGHANRRNFITAEWIFLLFRIVSRKIFWQ